MPELPVQLYCIQNRVTAAFLLSLVGRQLMMEFYIFIDELVCQ